MAESQHKLQVEVLTPEGPVYTGELVQLSARTSVGEVGILANHVPILARLVPHELRLHVSESDIERYAAAEGYLEVFANKARVLVGEAIPPDQLDASRLKQQLEEAERELGEAEEGTAAYETAEQHKRRAEAFLQIAEAG
jgi:F-type H+-transporting ATPase subunit epsilon